MKKMLSFVLSILIFSNFSTLASNKGMVVVKNLDDTQDVRVVAINADLSDECKSLLDDHSARSEEYNKKLAEIMADYKTFGGDPEELLKSSKIDMDKNDKFFREAVSALDDGSKIRQEIKNQHQEIRDNFEYMNDEYKKLLAKNEKLELENADLEKLAEDARNDRCRLLEPIDKLTKVLCCGSSSLRLSHTLSRKFWCGIVLGILVTATGMIVVYVLCFSQRALK